MPAGLRFAPLPILVLEVLMTMFRQVTATDSAEMLV